MKQLFYLPFWFIKARLLGIRRPLQTVLFISDKCNLACRHCNVYRTQNPHIKTYEEIAQELEYSFRLGSRFVDLEGGEPTLWRDGEHDLNSLIRLAKSIGFYSVTITTNAFLPFAGSEADSIWVSLDGLGAYHDDIRGKGVFERLVQNIEDARHPCLNVNMVINSRNFPSVAETVQFAADNPHIRSISLNFHNPYPGAEALELEQNTREEVIDLIIRMKRNGYPIMNSVSGLKLMKHSRFKKHCWITNFILSDGRRLPQCPGKENCICDRCGLSMSGEMNSIFNLRPDTVWAGLKVRM
ncbi:MAG: radical SAM protein [Tannerella sp.]|jgi:MoaA/NifB/PqqE/SkfB family radical SAM enzyme|nr:radical SAM protein [Tannerella sp.]